MWLLMAINSRRAIAKQLATRLLRNNIYKDNEYVLSVGDENMIVCRDNLIPQLHGTSFNDFKDGDGNSVGQLIQRVLGNRTGQISLRTPDTKSFQDGTIEENCLLQRRLRIGVGLSAQVSASMWSHASPVNGPMAIVSMRGRISCSFILSSLIVSY